MEPGLEENKDRTDRKLSLFLFCFCTLVHMSSSFSLWGFREIGSLFSCWRSHIKKHFLTNPTRGWRCRASCMHFRRFSGSPKELHRKTTGSWLCLEHVERSPHAHMVTEASPTPCDHTALQVTSQILEKIALNIGTKPAMCAVLSQEGTSCFHWWRLELLGAGG